eukprot:2031687-Prymnesium_polylepis.1
MGEAGLFHQLSGDMLDHAGVPSEVTLGDNGELHVTKELVCCHMPPFKNMAARRTASRSRIWGATVRRAPSSSATPTTVGLGGSARCWAAGRV